MADNRNSPKNAGQKETNTGKNTDPNVEKRDVPNAGGTKQNQLGNTPRSGDADACGPARRVSDIQPHMDVVSSCGCTMGKVDHFEGGAIKLTRNDSPDGQHHFIPTDWVERVDEHVHLKKTAEETQQEWKSDAAAATSGKA